MVVSIEQVALALGRTEGDIAAAITAMGFVNVGTVGPDLFAMLQEHFGPPDESAPEPAEVEPTSGPAVFFSPAERVKAKLVCDEPVRCSHVN